MHTIKVDVDNCRMCEFLSSGDKDAPRSFCALSIAMSMAEDAIGNTTGREYNFEEPLAEHPTKAPEWCPARKGVKVEVKQ